jgi:uncharacterized coiled-coil DUF342 family protein
MSKVIEHPNAALRREIDALKAKVKSLEEEIKVLSQHRDHTAKALVLIQEKHNQLRDLVMRSLLLMEKMERERKDSSQKKTGQ